jgi:hypothetical protein
LVSAARNSVHSKPESKSSAGKTGSFLVGVGTRVECGLKCGSEWKVVNLRDSVVYISLIGVLNAGR